MNKELIASAIDENKYKNKIEMVASSIKDAIMSGAIESGERLSSNELCELFGVSRAPVREALRRLESEGLVKIKPQQYVLVSEFHPQTFHELEGIRKCLEFYAFDLFCECYNDSSLDILADIVKTEDKSPTPKEAFDMALKFHHEMVRQTHNHELLVCYERIMGKLICYMNLHYKKESSLQPYHLMIVNALREGNCSLAKQILIEDLDECNAQVKFSGETT